MYITYHVLTGEAVRKHDVLRTVDVAHYCLRFRDWDTANAAWIADADVYQAIAAFGGVEITNAIQS